MTTNADTYSTGNGEEQEPVHGGFGALASGDSADRLRCSFLRAEGGADRRITLPGQARGQLAKHRQRHEGDRLLLRGRRVPLAVAPSGSNHAPSLYPTSACLADCSFDARVWTRNGFLATHKELIAVLNAPPTPHPRGLVKSPDARQFLLQFQDTDRAHHFADGHFSVV